MRVEVLPLIVNLCCLAYFIYKWQEPGKIIYWLGATLLTIGLLRMKG